MRYPFTCFLLLALAFLSVNANSQTITELFQMLPAELTPELNEQQREQLIQEGTYTLPGGNSDETIQYTIDIDTANDYLRCEYSFTTGQSAFFIMEIRRFKRRGGNPILVYSRYGGLKRAFGQLDLVVYDIKGSQLGINKQNLLPPIVSVSEFLQPGTPDSVKNVISSSSSNFYSLSPEEPDAISFNMYLQVVFEEDAVKNYIKGDVMLFTWTGRSFTRKLQMDAE